MVFSNGRVLHKYHVEADLGKNKHRCLHSPKFNSEFTPEKLRKPDRLPTIMAFRGELLNFKGSNSNHNVYDLIPLWLLLDWKYRMWMNDRDNPGTMRWMIMEIWKSLQNGISKLMRKLLSASQLATGAVIVNMNIFKGQDKLRIKNVTTFLLCNATWKIQDSVHQISSMYMKHMNYVSSCKLFHVSGIIPWKVLNLEIKLNRLNTVDVLPSLKLT